MMNNTTYILDKNENIIAEMNCQAWQNTVMLFLLRYETYFALNQYMAILLILHIITSYSFILYNQKPYFYPECIFYNVFFSSSFFYQYIENKLLHDDYLFLTVADLKFVLLF